MDATIEFSRLFLGTIIYRPYVYVFFICFLVFSVHQTGWRRTAVYTTLAWCTAFAAEYSATRNGFPFGLYHYLDHTRTRELWVSNVPFWDSLSFVFLSYFSFVLAAAALSKPLASKTKHGQLSGYRSAYAPLLGGLIMMALDVVIDPVTLRGDQWFLGKVYYYPVPGPHYGVTLENYAGWWFVGAVTQFMYQKFIFKPTLGTLNPMFHWGALGVYVGVFAFMVGVTIYINEQNLLLSHSLVISTVLVPLVYRLRLVLGENSK